MTLGRWLLVGLLLGACACNKGKDQKTAGSSSPPPLPPPPTTPLAATIGDKTTPVPNARIEISDDKIELVFSSVAIACDNKLKEEDGVAVSFDVPAGPSNGYFATGKPFGIAVRVSPPHAGVDYHDVSSHTARVTLEPFTPAKGAHVKGTVFADGGTRWTPKNQKFAATGTFDAVICEDARKKAPPPPEPPIGATLTGTVENKPFAGASMLASVFHTSDGTYLDSIDVYAEPGVTCANRNAKNRENLRIKPGGGRADAPLLGSPQPARLTWEKHIKTAESTSSTSSNASSLVRSWLTFESISFEAGGQVKASVVATTPATGEDKWSFGAKLVAEVCRYEL